MASLVGLFRSRVLPAIVAATGVSLIAAGLLTYTSGRDTGAAGLGDQSPAVTSPGLSPGPSLIIPTASGPLPSILPGATATDSAAATSGATPGASPSGGGSPVPSGASSPSPGPGVTAGPAGVRVATRVVVPALGIDVPVIRPPSGEGFPLCNVAMYLPSLSQPGRAGATYLYAHARAGMFLPLLDQSEINNGRAMLGMLVQVYTSDNRYFLYQVIQVRRHQVSLGDAIAAKDQELWLQTSEGPHGTPGKLQVIATPISNGAATSADAHPAANPVVCN